MVREGGREGGPSRFRGLGSIVSGPRRWRLEAATAPKRYLRDAQLLERVATSSSCCSLAGVTVDGEWHPYVLSPTDLIIARRASSRITRAATRSAAASPCSTSPRRLLGRALPRSARVGRSIEFVIPKKRGAVAPRFRGIRSWRPGACPRLRLSFRFGMASRRGFVPARTQAVLSAPVMSAACPDREG